jgi:cation diffusion facilitator family transporter
MTGEADTKVEMKRIKAIQIAAWIAVAGNALLAAAKITSGVFYQSVAVLGDGLDSLGDVVSSLLTVLAAAILIQPPDFDHPYGHQRADTIASKLLSFIIFFTGAQLTLSTVSQFLAKEPGSIPDIGALVITLISIVGKVLLSLFLMKKGKRLSSKMLLANAKNMRGDIIISLVVLVGILVSRYIDLGIIDIITGAVVGIWIMKTGVEIFLDTNMELMDGLQDPSVYFRVFDAVERVKGAHNPHRARIRRQGPWYIIDLDIEVKADLKVEEAHKICTEVEEEIRQTLPKVYDIMIHMEPLGNYEEGEKFGLNRERLSHRKKSSKK